jgi:hypothetical protein
MAIRKISIAKLLGISLDEDPRPTEPANQDHEEVQRQRLAELEDGSLAVDLSDETDPFEEEHGPIEYEGRLIPAPDPCFGPARPVRDQWDSYHYGKHVIDHQSPDYHG